MVRRRPAPGGGVVVEIGADRLTGWVNRFAASHPLSALTAGPDTVVLTSVDGSRAQIAVPFAPLRPDHREPDHREPDHQEPDHQEPDHREPLEALLAHLSELGPVGIIAVRAGAHSVGIARGGVVTVSSTDRAYVQGRTAAGGWSQQRYARRRGNQRTAALAATADTAARVLVPQVRSLAGLVVAGDAAAIRSVLADPVLAELTALPRREFRDIPEPRRSVLDDLAERVLTVDITVRTPPQS